MFNLIEIITINRKKSIDNEEYVFHIKDNITQIN